MKTPADGTKKLTLVHSPLLTEAPSVSNGAISISLAEQSSEKAPFVAYATLYYTGTTITNALVPFKFATSVIKVNCTGLKANTAIDIVTLSNVNTACKLTLSGTAAFETASSARVLTVAQGLDYCKYKNFSKNSLPTATSVNTVCQAIAIPTGALPGEFTINDSGKKIHFSHGNLYFDGADWGFEPEQYYFRTYNNFGKCDADGYSEDFGTASGHWGLFGWSTAYSNYGMIISNNIEAYPGDFVDWGMAYCESNNIADGSWRTLTGGTEYEWKYLFDNHDNIWGTCNDVPGRFIAPDDFEGGTKALSEAVNNWESAQAIGIIFLPAAGYRILDSVDNVGVQGCYWSSSECSEYEGYGMYFFQDGSLIKVVGYYRYSGVSVRLVTESI